MCREARPPKERALSAAILSLPGVTCARLGDLAPPPSSVLRPPRTTFFVFERGGNGQENLTLSPSDLRRPNSKQLLRSWRRRRGAQRARTTTGTERGVHTQLLLPPPLIFEHFIQEFVDKLILTFEFDAFWLAILSSFLRQNNLVL